MAGPLPTGYGPGRRRIPTAAKLGVAAVIANLAGMIAAVWCAQAIRAVPATASAETWWFVLYYTALCVVAVVDALLVDELVFKGGFRLSHLEGKDGARLNLKDDEATVAASMQRSSVSFPVVLILCGAVTYFVFNLVNHDFNPYYRRIGKYVSQLRGSDDATAPQRLQAIAALSIRRDPEIVPLLLQQLGRGGETGTWAAWALGRFADAKHHRKAIVEALWAASQEPDASVRREALLALARLQHRSVAEYLQAEIRAQLDAGALDRRLVYGTGFIQIPSSVPLLAEVLQRADVPTQRVAAWAIAQHRDQRDARDLDGLLEARLPSAGIATRCAIVHSLGIIGDERSNLALMHAYDAATPAERETTCGVESVFLRPDGKDEPADLLVPPDTFAMKILQVMGQIRATTPEIRTQVEPWLERLIAVHKDDSGLTASRAQSLLDGIRAGRDDTQVQAAPRP
jgi:HEAT repeat protein